MFVITSFICLKIVKYMKLKDAKEQQLYVINKNILVYIHNYICPESCISQFCLKIFVPHKKLPSSLRTPWPLGWIIE